jgi:hypothetical protein
VRGSRPGPSAYAASIGEAPGDCTLRRRKIEKRRLDIGAYWREVISSFFNTAGVNDVTAAQSPPNVIFNAALDRAAHIGDQGNGNRTDDQIQDRSTRSQTS